MFKIKKYVYKSWGKGHSASASVTGRHSSPHPFVLDSEELADYWLSGLVFQG